MYEFAQVMGWIFLIALVGWIFSSIVKKRKSKKETEPTKKGNLFWRVVKRTAKVGLVLLIGFSILAFIGVEQDAKLQRENAAVVTPKCALDNGTLLKYINDERTKLGRPPLQLDQRLINSSQARLADMETNKYFGHGLLDGNKKLKFITDQGVTGSLSEDLGSNDNTPQQSWAEFKVSPAHYESLTRADLVSVGIATKCTDYTMTKDTDSPGSTYEGSKITDITVIHLSSSAPQRSADVAQTVPRTLPPSQPGCISDTIPFGSETRQASWLDVGQSQTTLGMNGYKVTCGGKVVSDVPPIKTVVYQGSRPLPTPPAYTPSPSYTPPSQPDRNALIQACVQRMQTISPGSSAYMQCYSAY